MRDFELKVKRLLGLYYYTKRKDAPLTITNFRLWKCNTDDLEEIFKWDSKMAYTQSKIDAVPCNIYSTEEDKTRKVEDLNFIDGTIFLVEAPIKDKEYVFKPIEDEVEKQTF